DGFYGAVGMAGTDLNLGKLASSLSGINVLYQNHRINSYSSEQGLEANVALRALYSYGDKEGRNTYKDLLSGDTRLAVDESLNANAQTVTGADGVKTIVMQSLSNDVNAGVNAGITLQHESYRDGEMSADQQLETLLATQGHTGMAARVLQDQMYAGAVLRNENLKRDLYYATQGSDAFAQYVGAAYDSSADYWKLTADGGLEYDGEGYLRGVNGEYIRDKDGNKIGADGIESGLIAIMQKAGVNLTSEQAAQMLAEAGFQHTNPDSEDTSTWMWNITGEDGQQVNMGAVLSAAAFGEDSTYGAIATALQTGLNNRFVDWQTSWNGATDAQRAYFNGYSENSYQELFAYYNANDEVWAEGSPIAWFVNNTSEVTIGGRTFATHNDSIPKFEQLAQTLTDEQFNYLMAGSVGSLNARFVRGSTEYLSDHAFGQAIDFYPDSNPFIVFDPSGENQQANAAHSLMQAAANGTAASLQDFDTFMAANSRLHAIRDMGNSDVFIDNFLATYTENQQTLNTLGQLVNAGGPVDNWMINAYNSAQQYNTNYAGLNTLLTETNNPLYAQWIDDGVVNLDPTYINALTQSGFDWGALFYNRIDGMHFYY
ncbi:MAG: hypothetical protein JW837_02570, partial [Sedimentisphaerales bacterium]|nr:hypothetical protein [Sedimentisphaerales bacterium]